MPVDARLKRYFDRAGEVVSLRQKGGTYNVTTGVATISDTDETVSGIFVADDELMAGSIPEGTQGMLLPSKDLALIPKAGDTIFVGDDQYVVKQIKSVHVGGKVVAYELGLDGVVQ